LLNAPDRPTLVELTLFANERWSGAFENPNVKIGGLLADHGGDHSGEAPKFDVEDIVDGPTRCTTDAKGHLSSGFDGDGDQPRLCCGGGKGSFVSGVDGRNFNSRLGGRPFDTSDGRSRWSSLIVPSSAWEVTFPVAASMRTSIGLGKEGPRWIW
jgi:hypothetical protein